MRRARVIAIAALLLGTAVACQRKALVVLLVPLPLVHDIGAWPDDDQVCVPLPVVGQIYIRRRCVAMGTVRALILQTQLADDGAQRSP